MANEGKDVTNPNLDLEDFLGLAGCDRTAVARL